MFYEVSMCLGVCRYGLVDVYCSQTCYFLNVSLIGSFDGVCHLLMGKISNVPNIHSYIYMHYLIFSLFVPIVISI